MRLKSWNGTRQKCCYHLAACHTALHQLKNIFHEEIAATAQIEKRGKNVHFD